MSRLVSVWRIMNLPCREMSRLASESLDRDLSRLERIALRSHSLYCSACRRYARQIVTLRDALRRLASHLETDQALPGPGLPVDVRDRIKRALEER
ncbi:MAG: zf-HC2 domain-containing protein [Planctomycetia bacterium]|nr:zf-HC2 domain-containing protein [Planctomycetia bacterium]